MIQITKPTLHSTTDHTHITLSVRVCGKTGPDIFICKAVIWPLVCAIEFNLVSYFT